MSDRCRLFMIYQLLAAGALFPFCTYWLPGPEVKAAFGFGLLLYTANALLLAYLVDRLFQVASNRASGARPGQRALVGLALLKFSFVGVGVLLGLVVFRLPAIPLVGGAFAGLVSTTIVSLVSGKKTLFSKGDLRY
jgi:hypothetical protein